MDNVEEKFADEQPRTIDALHKEALSRMVVVMKRIRERSEEISQKDVFEPVFSHLSGILAHAKYINKGGEDLFVSKNKDDEFDMVHVNNKQELKWIHLRRADRKVVGYRMWGPKEDSEDISIDSVVGAGFSDQMDERAFDMVQSATFPFQEWTFLNDGKILFHEDPPFEYNSPDPETDGIGVFVNIDHSPLVNSFMVKKES